MATAVSCCVLVCSCCAVLMTLLQEEALRARGRELKGLMLQRRDQWRELRGAAKAAAEEAAQLETSLAGGESQLHNSCVLGGGGTQHLGCEVGRATCMMHAAPRGKSYMQGGSVEAQQGLMNEVVRVRSALQGGGH